MRTVPFGRPAIVAALRNRQFSQRLAEIDLGCRRDPIGALAQENLVHVQRQNFLFREFALDLGRQEQFLGFATKGPVARQEIYPGELLGDGAATLAAGTRDREIDGRAQDALVIESRVLEKAVVLCGQEGLDHLCGMSS